jgi:arylsulfatase A-like enzyme
MGQKNFLIIVTDQQRVDTLGAYGSQICQTPALDRLAASGIRFVNAFSTCALSSPARASLYTGLYPHRHGIVANDDEFNDGARLIAHDFRDTGYRCGLIGKWHCGSERLPRGFGFEGMNLPGYGNCAASDAYRDYLRRNNLEPGNIVPRGTGFYDNILLCGALTGPEEASIPYFVAQQTIDMLAGFADTSQPFLLICNFWGPHPPYLPCEPYASMYDPSDIPPWGNFHDNLGGKPNAHRRYRDAFLGEANPLRTWEEWSTWIATYYGFVTMIDAQIGRILDALDVLDLADKTTILFTTDHGDLIGGHGGIFGKDAMMYQELYHIPFLMRGPDLAVGETADQPVTHVDILPTLLDLASIDPGRPLDGSSLVPSLTEDGQDKEPDVLCVFNGDYLPYQARMVTNGKQKYVFNAPEIDEYYDLQDDPWELHNLQADDNYQEAVAYMRSRLLYWAERINDPLLVSLNNLFAERVQVRPEEYTPWPGEWR